MSFIFEKKYSIPTILCDEIVIMYELENIKHPGETISGVHKHIKDTTDMLIPKKDIKWYKIEEFLYSELSNSIKEYYNFIGNNVKSDSDRKYSFFDTNDIHTDFFMIQKYNKQEGKYIYHCDSNVEYSNNRHRVLTFLWYLNDVEIGGETEFWNGQQLIKPQKGKLLIFPACWSYPHRGNMPLSSDKYIITGWFYIK
jgi:hypothetical protein